MNLILFIEPHATLVLPDSDPRSVHLREVLRRQVGQTFDAGAMDGPIGKGMILAETAQGLHLAFEWGTVPPPPPDVTVLAGLPRPATARKILFEAACLGVRRLFFFPAAKGEPSYRQSHLWDGGPVVTEPPQFTLLPEWQRLFMAGAEQAFATRIPELRHFASLDLLVAGLASGGWRGALDNYEAMGPLPLGAVWKETAPFYLALGAERGWSGQERTVLRNHSFRLYHLGPRVLRSESALTAAHTLLVYPWEKP